jgi:hypothetical protein
VNIADDAATYLLCMLAHEHCHGLCAKRVVEPRLLVLKSLMSLVELVKARLLLLAAILILHRVATSGNVRRCGLTFRGDVIGVDHVGLLLEDETLAPRVMGRRRILVGRHALGLITTRLRG